MFVGHTVSACPVPRPPPAPSQPLSERGHPVTIPYKEV